MQIFTLELILLNLHFPLCHLSKSYVKSFRYDQTKKIPKLFAEWELQYLIEIKTSICLT